MPWVIIITLAYFLGSLPAAYIAGYLFRGIDIRHVGDGNMGAANAYRELGAGIGIIVGLIDAGKGALAVLIAQSVQLPQLAVLTAGFAAVIGHNWPVFLGFRGGRGLSTTIGVLLVLVTQPVLIAGTPAAILLLVKKNVTLSSAALFVSLPLSGWWLGASGLLILYGMALPVIVGITHLLRTGTELAHRV